MKFIYEQTIPEIAYNFTNINKTEKISKKVLTFPFRGDILSELSGTTVKKKASEATKEQNSSLTTEQ